MEYPSDKGIRITWLGHACFLLESQDYRIVLDPYEDQKVPGYGTVRQQAHQVLCSHDHGDHNYTAAVALLPEQPCPFHITVLDTFHDDRQGALRGTDRIHIFDNGTLRVAHLGDLGCELTPAQKDALKGLDAVMIPIGGYYTIDAVQAKKLVDQIRPRVILPMHYRNGSLGYDVISTLEPFTDLFDTVVEYPGNTLEITPDTDPHVAVLTYEFPET